MSDPAQRRKQLAEAVMRDSICEATASALAETGLAGLTMDRIAQLADVSKGTLYNYFRDRDSLLAEMVSRAFAPLDVELDEIVDSAADVYGALVAVIKAILEYAERHHGLGKVLCGAEAPPFLVADFHAKHVRLRNRVVALLQRAKQAGALRSDCPELGLVARMFTVALRGIVNDRIFYSEDSPSLDTELEALTACIVRPWFKESN